MKRINIKIYKAFYLPVRNEFLFLLILFIISVMSSCRPKFYEAPSPGAPNAGSVSFNKYVAVGSTISAGYADGALYNESQSKAYPNLIAARIKEVNPALAWVQPDIDSPEGWQFNTSAQNPNNKYGHYRFATPSCSSVNLLRDTTSGQPSVSPLPVTVSQAGITNLSIPFISFQNLNTASVPGSTTSSVSPAPYYNRTVNTGTTRGLASEAKARQATFFTIFAGYEDFLAAAKSGVSTGVPASAVYQQQISDLLDSLLSVPGSKGAIATLPYVDLFPVITNNNRRITSASDPAKNPVRFRDQKYADSLNTIIGVPGLFSGAAGNKNNYAITTAAGIRQLNASKDFVVKGSVLDLSGFGYKDASRVRTCIADSAKRSGKGFNAAFADAEVLDASEVKNLRDLVDAYNLAIRTVVSQKNAGGIRVAIVDLNKFYTLLTDPLYGIRYGSTVVRANHPSLGPDYGGFYSLDRAYPTPKGQALLANEFIKVINATWGASLQQYDPANFRGNDIP